MSHHTDELKADAKEKIEGAHAPDSPSAQASAVPQDSGVERLKGLRGKVDKTSGIAGEISTGFDLIKEDNDGLENAAPETQQVLKAYNVQETMSFTGDKVSAEFANSLPKTRLEPAGDVAGSQDIPAESWWEAWNTPTRTPSPVPAS